MPIPTVEDDVAQTSKELVQLELDNSDMEKRIAEEYDRLMDEFWRRFPPLTSVPEIRLSSASIRSWIERRAGTAR